MAEPSRLKLWNFQINRLPNEVGAGGEREFEGRGAGQECKLRSCCMGGSDGAIHPPDHGGEVVVIGGGQRFSLIGQQFPVHEAQRQALGRGRQCLER